MDRERWTPVEKERGEKRGSKRQKQREEEGERDNKKMKRGKEGRQKEKRRKAKNESSENEASHRRARNPRTSPFFSPFLTHPRAPNVRIPPPPFRSSSLTCAVFSPDKRSCAIIIECKPISAAWLQHRGWITVPITQSNCSPPQAKHWDPGNPTLYMKHAIQFPAIEVLVFHKTHHGTALDFAHTERPVHARHELQFISIEFASQIADSWPTHTNNNQGRLSASRWCGHCYWGIPVFTAMDRVKQRRLKTSKGGPSNPTLSIWFTTIL